MPALSHALRLTTSIISGSREIIRVLFIPSGSDSLIDSNGDTFKVKE